MNTPQDNANAVFYDDWFSVRAKDGATDSEIQSLIASLQALVGVKDVHFNYGRGRLIVVLDSGVMVDHVVAQAKALPLVKNAHKVKK